MKQLNQKGAVALISVVIFAIILAIITSAYMFNVIAQQRQSITYDLGTRAYYTAESGVQDAVRGLNNSQTLRQNGQTDCKPLQDGTGGSVTGDLGGSSNYKLQYTCQIINTTPTAVSGTVGETVNMTIQLNPANNVTATSHKLIIHWSEMVPTSTPIASALCPIEETASTANSNFLRPYSEWRLASPSCRAHPMIRMALINHPKTNFTRADVTQQVRFLNPLNATAPLTATTAGLSDGNDNIDAFQMNQLISNAKCYRSNSATSFSDGGSNYACRAIIDLSGYSFVNDTIYVRLHSIYGSNVKFQVSLQDSTGVPIPLSNTQAVIDVTGKAGGNVFKRVRQTVNIGEMVTTDTLPDAGLVAGNGICKDFQISSAQSAFSAICSP